MKIRHDSGPSASAIGAALILFVSLSHSPVSATDGRILVPGGTDAVSRLLGYVRTDPEVFSASLNRVLLQTVRNDHAWQDVPARVDLVELIQTVGELRSTFEFPLEFEGGTARAAGELDVFSRTLGYNLRSREFPLQFDAPEGRFFERRRRVAHALGWNLTRIADRVNEGERVTIEISIDEVEPILPLEKWQNLTGRHVRPDNALTEMVKDQPLGLVAEGMRRQTRETREALADEHQWIYRNASTAFFRHSAAFVVRDGALVLPGGPETAEAWSALVGVSTAAPRRFLGAILTVENSTYAHIWSGLYYLPESVARYWVEHYVASPYDDSRLSRVVERLKDAHGTYFSRRARGRADAFPFLARVVPIEGNHADPLFQGEPTVWLQSARDGSEPLTRESIARSLSLAGREEMGPDEALAAIVTGTASMDRFPVVLYQRHAGIARVLETSPELLTPEVVVALGRAQARFPATIGVIERMRLTRPESVRDYFLAVGRLDELEYGARREVLLSHFQGGVELIATLYEAGHVSGEILQNALDAWTRMHLETDGIDELLLLQPGWLRSLIGQLPAAAPAWPGRGPLERAWLAGMTRGDDPQYLRRGDLLYRGTRSHDQASRLLQELEKERIPSLDWMLGLLDSLEQLQAACVAGDVEAARPIASTALELLRDPGALAPPVQPDDPPRKKRLEPLLETIAAESASRRLASYASKLEVARIARVRHLRPVFIAPAYFPVLSRIENIVLSELPLIRRHSVQQRRAVDSIGAPDPAAAWKSARMVRGAATEFGGHASGHLSGVTQALLGLHVQSLQSGSRTLGLLTRQEWWYADAVTWPWHEVTPEVSRFVTVVIAAGDEIIEQATTEARGSGGPRFSFVRARIPAYRIERRTHSDGVVAITPSERLAVGLAALRGDAFGPEDPDLLSPTTRAALARAAEALPTSPVALTAIGASSPHIDGRRSPWVGTWPPYEALDRESTIEALAERELLDLRLTIIEHLARHDLPGKMGADLEMYLVEQAPKDLRLEDESDWETVISWMGRLDDAYLDRGIRWCMTRGFYRVQDF